MTVRQQMGNAAKFNCDPEDSLKIGRRPIWPGCPAGSASAHGRQHQVTRTRGRNVPVFPGSALERTASEALPCPARLGGAQRRGFSAIELLVVIAVLAVVAAIAMPAVLACQEAARRAACANNFRQIGLATAGYVDAFGCFPPSAVTPWTVALTPYLEDSQVYDAYDHRADPFSDPANISLGAESIKPFVCPSDSEQRVSPFDWVSSNVAGNVEFFRPNSRPQSCVDGLSRTGLCVEVSARKGLTQIEGPKLYLGVEDSIHPAGFQLLFADGSVRLMPHNTSANLMQALGTPRGGEIE